MTRQIPKAGDVFAIPLDDGSSTIGQVLETQPILMNSITCTFFDARGASPDFAEPHPLEKFEPISCQFVTRDQFNKGDWRRLGNTDVQFPTEKFPYRETEASGWIGAKVIGSGIINSFLSAFYGLRDWKEMKDPEYYSKLLLPGVSHPT